MSRRLALCIVLAALATAGVRPAAQGPAPTMTVRDQTATLSSPLAMLNESTSAVSILFATTPPSAAAEAAARTAGAWTGALAQTGPSVVVDLAFTPGSTSGLVGQLTACAITAHGFRAPLAIAGNAAACHIVSVGGLLKSGGGMAGLLEGTGAGYALRLPFAMALGESLATTAAAAPAAVGSRAAAPAAPAVPLNTVTGSGTYQGQTVTVTHGLAWWAAAQNEVRVELFAKAPRPGLIEDARKGEFNGDEAPVISVYVGFDGAARDLAAANFCFVNVTFPKGGPIGLNTKPKDCGLEVLTTTGQPGGTVVAVLKGSGPGPAGPVSWDVTFHLPIAP
ncbi:MAG: hypothetical protein R2708_22310 [Vicinamibacterales bacterium]